MMKITPIDCEGIDTGKRNTDSLDGISDEHTRRYGICMDDDSIAMHRSTVKRQGKGIRIVHE